MDSEAKEGQDKIIEAQYLHKGNVEAPYLVLGLAHRVDSLDSLPNQVEEIGIALGVAGYEETGEVSGEQIQLIRTDKAGGVRLYYIKLGEFEAPDIVVAYKQLKQGHYSTGQLWWRPPENFQQHFTLAK